MTTARAVTNEAGYTNDFSFKVEGVIGNRVDLWGTKKELIWRDVAVFICIDNGTDSESMLASSLVLDGLVTRAERLMIAKAPKKAFARVGGVEYVCRLGSIYKRKL
jgi:hypothetical protein